jgi:hypothetical protein
LIKTIIKKISLKDEIYQKNKKENIFN